MKSLFDKVNAKLNAQGGFLKAVSVLVGGTAFAQGIAILALPILTRLYTPEEFSLFAVYTSILGVLAVAACLRFEIAIPLPIKNEDALSVVCLAMFSNIAITLLICTAIFFFQDDFFIWSKQPQLKAFAWLIPLGVFLTGLYNALQYWTTRQKQFSTIAKTRMTQSLAGSSVQIGSGYLSLSVFGLIIGQIISSSAGIIRLFLKFWQESRELFRLISINRLKENFRKYDKFPKYSTFEALANNAAIHLPVIIIAAVALGAEAGYLMLAMKVMAIPMSLIGNAIAQVYLAHAPEYYKQNQLGQYTTQIIRQIVKVAVLPLILVGMISPFLFPIIFGAAWTQAGHMVLWMIPWFIMQIISSPVSMSLHITNNQKVALLLQIAGLFIRVGGLLLISISYSNLIFEYYAVSGFVFYSLYLIVILKVLRIKLSYFIGSVR